MVIRCCSKGTRFHTSAMDLRASIIRRRSIDVNGHRSTARIPWGSACASALIQLISSCPDYHGSRLTHPSTRPTPITALGLMCGTMSPTPRPLKLPPLFDSPSPLFRSLFPLPAALIKFSTKNDIRIVQLTIEMLKGCKFFDGHLV